MIFAANHASHADTPLLLSCLPLRFRHRTVVAAPPTTSSTAGGRPTPGPSCSPPSPSSGTKVNRRSAELAADLLADGWNLVIFPEGGRSPDGWAQDVPRAGPPIWPSAPAAPVVPVHLDGTRHSCPRAGRALRRTRTTDHLRHPVAAAARRERPPVRCPHRSRGGHHGQRGRHRLVDRPQPGSERRHSPAAGPANRDLAPCVGPGRRRWHRGASRPRAGRAGTRLTPRTESPPRSVHPDCGMG